MSALIVAGLVALGLLQEILLWRCFGEIRRSAPDAFEHAALDDFDWTDHWKFTSNHTRVRKFVLSSTCGDLPVPRIRRLRLLFRILRITVWGMFWLLVVGSLVEAWHEGSR